jgi:hypothetical protein
MEKKRKEEKKFFLSLFSSLKRFLRFALKIWPLKKKVFRTSSSFAAASLMAEEKLERLSLEIFF